MRKLLLTSSAVSVLATAFTVILCTLALFFSGYTIQQRTLRQLRAAIRPRESPLAQLPERFRPVPVKLEDGTIVLLESEAERSILEQRDLFAASEPTVEAKLQPSSIADQEVAPAGPAAADTGDGDEDEDGDGDMLVEGGKATRKQIKMMEQITAQAAQKAWAVENPDPLSKDKAPVSRAQRRRMIKEEIQRLAHGQEPVYYQRRLW
ncbi:hypothetical protein ESCO_004050 [Escovopsis weberi]|uniref:Uncharacterized protein n=1 Tax=Escovopsis weberi TaxID=150374 RepID=A0A0M9VVN5_ESCWE|nr:hypothetical protein ESCO_004050 [Escovopsis weberi]